MNTRLTSYIPNMGAHLARVWFDYVVLLLLNGLPSPWPYLSLSFLEKNMGQQWFTKSSELRHI